MKEEKKSIASDPPVTHRIIEFEDRAIFDYIELLGNYL